MGAAGAAGAAAGALFVPDPLAVPDVLLPPWPTPPEASPIIITIFFISSKSLIILGCGLGDLKVVENQPSNKVTLVTISKLKCTTKICNIAVIIVGAIPTHTRIIVFGILFALIKLTDITCNTHTTPHTVGK